MDDEPFSGVNGRTSIFDWWKVASLQHLYAEIHGNPSLTDDEREVLQRYRQILGLADEAVFREGKTYDLGYCQPAWFDRSGLFVFLRGDGKDLRLVVANFSASPQSGEIVIPEEAAAYLGMEKRVVRVNWTAGANDFTVINL